MIEDDDYQPERGLKFAFWYCVCFLLIVIVGIFIYIRASRAEQLGLYLPPVKYDHPYKGPSFEKIVPFYKISEYCGDAKETDPAVRSGCSILILGICYMILADLPENQQAETRRHENGHCNETQATLLSNSAHVGWRNPPPKINWVQIPNRRQP